MVSVIVPIYNTEMELDKCIISILDQTYKDLELILIDDGSTDHSLQICKKYVNIDNRISLLHKNNEGVSATRNIGIESAKGEYLLFVDSDDYIKSDMIEKLISKSEYDLVISGYYKCNNGESIPYIPFQKICNSNAEILNLVCLKQYVAFMTISTCKLYNRKILIDKNIRFDRNLSYGEDTCFVYQYLKYTENCYFIPLPLYYNVIRQGSLSRCYIEDAWGSMYKVFKVYLSVNANNKAASLVLMRSIKLSIVNAVYYKMDTNKFSNMMKEIRNIDEWNIVDTTDIHLLSINGIVLFLTKRSFDKLLYNIFRLKLRR